VTGRAACVVPATADPGRPCGDFVDQVIAGIPLCSRHAGKLHDWHATLMADENAPFRAEEDREERAYRNLMRSWQALGPQIVYYLERGDGLIKIGTTVSLRARMSSLRSEHGDLRILLTHCGAFARELEMHRKFADLRVTGEWFAPGTDLLAWIIGRRRKLENVRTRIDGTVPLGAILELTGTVAA
jgi:predicted TIM-barrel fold metal-dependent hydrolase